MASGRQYLLGRPSELIVSRAGRVAGRRDRLSLSLVTRLRLQVLNHATSYAACCL